ncbi:GldG family protein [Candidatus Sumerlaeota bacterium]|nr:GldG family protein [Candidatus Sumerlaeota bacterium]
MSPKLKWLTIAGVLMMIAANVIAGFSGGFSIFTFLLGGAGLVFFLSLAFSGESANLAGHLRFFLNMAFILGTFVFLYLICSNHNQKWDLTKNRQFSLSPQTVRYLQSVSKPITVTGFSVTPQDMRRFFEQYAAHTDMLKVEIKNPLRDFREAQRLKTDFDTDISPGDIFIEFKDRKKKIDKLEESAFINALVEIQREKDTTIYFLAGHGEGPLDEPTDEQLQKNVPSYYTLKRICEERGIIVKTLELMRSGVVPEDASVLVCAGPRIDLYPAEQDGLEQWLDSGGRFILMLDPPKSMEQTFPRFKGLLRKYGIELRDDIVMDPNKASMEQFGLPVIPLVTGYAKHPIAEGVPQAGVALFLPLARTVEPSASLPPSISATTIMRSSPYSWSQPIEALFQEKFTPPERERISPQSLAVAATKVPPGSTEDQQTRLVVFGDSDIFTDVNIAYQVPVYLFMNSVSWLTQMADVVAIPPRVVDDTPMTLTAGQKEFLAILLIILTPCLVFFGGLGYALIRRKTR